MLIEAVQGSGSIVWFTAFKLILIEAVQGVGVRFNILP
jgi:hypothetical protein